MFDLALLNELFDRSCDILHRHLGVDAVLIEEVDVIRLQALQHPLGCDLDMIGTAVEAAKTLPRNRVDVPAELGGDYHLSAEWRQGFTDEFFVPERAVGFRGVEECDATLDGGTDDGNHLLL